jgi:uncharacterized protein YcbK (DUF882 family)
MVYDQKALDRLQILRTIIAKPFIISSGYRCRYHNESVGGAKDSRHLYGSAFDVITKAFDSYVMWDLIHEAMKLGFGCIIYSGWVHLDLRPGKPVLIYGKK